MVKGLFYCFPKIICIALEPLGLLDIVILLELVSYRIMRNKDSYLLHDNLNMHPYFNQLSTSALP